MKMKRVFGLMTAAGCALCAVSAKGAATTVVTENFEGVVAPAELSALGNTWSGYGSVTAATYTAAYADAGSPISGTHAQVLAVEGRVTRTAVTSQSNASVDMMVQIATPDDELQFPSSVTPADVQIAVGVESNNTLKVYCKNTSDVAGWYSLGDTVYVPGSWHRVSFSFNYTQKTCQILVDGDPVVTSYGYATADKGTANGSWYKLNKDSESALASVEVIGSTSIDDLLVQDSATATEVVPAIAGNTTTNGVTVPNSWFVEQGVSRETAGSAAPDGTGMTVAQKYRTGLSVNDSQKFTISAMSMKEVAGVKYATLTLPATAVPSGYANKIQYKTANGNWADATLKSGDSIADGTVDVPVTDDAVIYLRLVNETTTP